MRFFFGAFICIILTSFPAGAQSTGGAETLSAMENYRRGRELEDQNRMNEANTHYNEAVRQCLEEVSGSTASRTTYTVLTWTLQRQKKYNEVITWGERGLRVFPDEYRLVEIMGEAFFYLADYRVRFPICSVIQTRCPRGIAFQSRISFPVKFTV